MKILDRGGFVLITKTFNFPWLMGSHPYPENKIIFDITEFLEYISFDETYDIFINIFDLGMFLGSFKTGFLTNFSVEYYDDYSTGMSNIILVSDDVPFETVNNAWVNAKIKLSLKNKDIDICIDEGFYKSYKVLDIKICDFKDDFLFLKKLMIDKII